MVNPAAASIYEVVDQQTQWRNSQVKTDLEDGNWHHLALIVNATHLVYSHDAVFQDAVALTYG